MKRESSIRTVKNLAGKFTLLFVVIAVFSFGLIIIKEISNKFKLDKEISLLNQEIEQLQLTNQGLLGMIDSYSNDFYLEEQARSKMNLKKPGEQVVVVDLESINLVDKNLGRDLPAAAAAAAESGRPASNIVRWWDYFFAESMAGELIIN